MLQYQKLNINANNLGTRISQETIQSFLDKYDKLITSHWHSIYLGGGGSQMSTINKHIPTTDVERMSKCKMFLNSDFNVFRFFEGVYVLSSKIFYHANIMLVSSTTMSKKPIQKPRTILFSGT